MKISKRILILIGLTIFIVNQVSAQVKSLDNIEAVVNKDIILHSDLNRAEKKLKNFYKDNKRKLPTGIDLTKQLLDKLIGDSLQLQVAEQIGLRIKSISCMAPVII